MSKIFRARSVTIRSFPVHRETGSPEYVQLVREQNVKIDVFLFRYYEDRFTGKGLQRQKQGKLVAE